jgi:hypothetical protein
VWSGCLTAEQPRLRSAHSAVPKRSLLPALHLVRSPPKVDANGAPYLPICAGCSGDIAGRWGVGASFAGTQTPMPVVGPVGGIARAAGPAWQRCGCL